MDRAAVDHSKMKLEHRAVLDWLARRPAQVFDFAEVAREMNIKRGVAEEAIIALKHPRNGAHLIGVGPDGTQLRARHAYLPPHADIRKDYPAMEHPPHRPEKQRPPALPPPRKVDAARQARQAEKDERRAKELTARRDQRRAVHVRIVESAAADRAERVRRNAALYAPSPESEAPKAKLEAVKPEPPKSAPKKAAPEPPKESDDAAGRKQ